MQVIINVPESHLKQVAFAMTLIDTKNELRQEIIERFLATEQMELDTNMFDSEEKKNEFFKGLSFVLMVSYLDKNLPKEP